MPKAENVSTGLKTKFQMTNFLDLKAKKRLGNHCTNKTGATKEIKRLRKVDWEEPKPLKGKNFLLGKGGRQKRKTAGFKAESFLPTPSEEESQLYRPNRKLEKKQSKWISSAN